MKSIAFALIACGLFSVQEAAAAAVTIDFQPIMHVGSGAFTPCDGQPNPCDPSVYTEDGFTLAESGFGFGTFGTLDPSYAGSTALFSDTLKANVTLSGPTPFTLYAIDLALLGGLGSTTVTFTGTTAGGLAPAVTFTLTDATLPFDLLTFLFPAEFTDLVSVTWSQAGSFALMHQFDDIVVESTVATGVPEPSSLILFGTGAAALLARKRRK